MSKVYIFGYGSLISEDSRKRTSTTSEAVPARVKGLDRGWYIRNSDYLYASVAVVRKDRSYCNGVLFEVAASMLQKFDTREYGYVRVELERGAISLVDGALNQNDKVFTYCVENIDIPDHAHPIPLSYVDVMMQGCLEYGEDFAREFVATTSRWDSVWLDDLFQPIYVRPLGGTVDREVLQQFYIQELLAERKISRTDYLEARLEFRTE